MRGSKARPLEQLLVSSGKSAPALLSSTKAESSSSAFAAIQKPLAHQPSSSSAAASVAAMKRGADAMLQLEPDTAMLDAEAESARAVGLT